MTLVNYLGGAAECVTDRAEHVPKDLLELGSTQLEDVEAQQGESIEAEAVEEGRLRAEQLVCLVQYAKRLSDRPHALQIG